MSNILERIDSLLAYAKRNNLCDEVIFVGRKEMEELETIGSVTDRFAEVEEESYLYIDY